MSQNCLHTSCFRAVMQMKSLITFQNDPGCTVLVMDASASLGLDLSFVTHVYLMEPIWDRRWDTAFLFPQRKGSEVSVYIICEHLKTFILPCQVRQLFCADHVFTCCSVEEQVVSRAHRMGAIRPVLVETLAMRGTIEQQILEFLQVNHLQPPALKFSSSVLCFGQVLSLTTCIVGFRIHQAREFMIQVAKEITCSKTAAWPIWTSSEQLQWPPKTSNLCSVRIRTSRGI